MAAVTRWLKATTKRWRRQMLFTLLPRGLYFPRLGTQGRLGNQLFQYATLRTLAEQLGRRYYCPEWAGDELFDLRDSNRIRVPFSFNTAQELWLNFTDRLDHLAHTIEHEYRGKVSFNGHPETERLFDPPRARRWFTLRGELREAIESRYKHFDFENTVSLHVRLKPPLNIRDKVVCQLPYYRKALELCGRENVLVFSDDMLSARDMLAPILHERNFIFKTEPNDRLPPQLQDYEDVHLMSLCRDNVICVSTYSWWGAWLNEHPDKRVVCPVPWFQYGCQREFPYASCPGWTRLHADGEERKLLVIKPRGSASQRRAVIISAKIWAEHLNRELRSVWQREPDCDAPLARMLPGCRVEHVDEQSAPRGAGCLQYSQADLVRASAGTETADISDSGLLAIPSSLAGYEHTIMMETGLPFRPCWMLMDEYRAESARWQAVLFPAVNRSRAVAA